MNCLKGAQSGLQAGLPTMTVGQLQPGIPVPASGIWGMRGSCRQGHGLAFCLKHQCLVFCLPWDGGIAVLRVGFSRICCLGSPPASPMLWPLALSVVTWGHLDAYNKNCEIQLRVLEEDFNFSTVGCFTTSSQSRAYYPCDTTLHLCKYEQLWPLY